MNDSPLLCQTPPSWTTLALDHFDALLADHAHCEKKAAAHAMALIAQYPHVDALLLPLSALAREELGHFRQVIKLLQQRGLSLGPDGGDPYVKALLKHCRHGPDERLADRLLVSGIVEARSAERLQMVAEGLPTGDLKTFYHSLAVAEAGHHRLFVRLSTKIIGRRATDVRFEELLRAERDVMHDLPLLPRMH